MDSKVIAALIGLGGISLGALLGGLGYYLKSRAERLQSKKLVLFYLLEFRHLLKSSYVNPKEITERYIIYCDSFFKRIGIDGNEGIPSFLQVAIEEHMSNLLKALTPRIDEKFIDSFEVSLQELCKNSPVLAFSLRGKESVKELIRAQQNYAENIHKSGCISATPHINEFLSKHLDKASELATEELITDIDKDILLVSWSCGILTWLSCKKLTAHKRKQQICFKEAGVDELLERMVKELAESNGKLSQQDTMKCTSSDS